jgi:hypothetical protein
MMESKNDIGLRKSILKTLLYYDIFNHPLKAEEIYRYLDRNSASTGKISEELQRLCSERIVFKFGDFFTVQEDPTLIDRRLRGNRRADQSIPAALKTAKLIAAFPFVRGVLASGSLSKGYMDEKSDVDFFIITAARRVWIPRMMLVLYKRLFLHNSHKQFCVNYFIDEDHLEIEEKNIFTATELVSVLPLYNRSIYIRLIQQNDRWLKKFFPNYRMRSTEQIFPETRRAPKWMFEMAINFLGGNFFERVFMNITLSYWKKRYSSSLSPEDFDVAFKTKEYVSKGHPNNFQKKVIEILRSKMRAFHFEKQESEI